MKKFAMITLVVIMIAALLVPATFATVAGGFESPHKPAEGSHPADYTLPPTGSNAADYVIDHTGEAEILAALAAKKVYGISINPNPVVQGQAAVATSEAAYSNYVGTLLDGQPVAVEVSEGSTIVTLSAETTAALSVGTHTIVIESKDGAASASFEVVAGAAAEGAAAEGAGVEATAGTTGSAQAGEAAGAEQAAVAAAGEAAAAAAAAAASAASTPKTGDSSNTVMWAAISLVTLGAIGVVALPLVKKVKA